MGAGPRGTASLLASEVPRKERSRTRRNIKKKEMKESKYMG